MAMFKTNPARQLTPLHIVETQGFDFGQLAFAWREKDNGWVYTDLERSNVCRIEQIEW